MGLGVSRHGIYVSDAGPAEIADTAVDPMIAFTSRWWMTRLTSRTAGPPHERELAKKSGGGGHGIKPQSCAGSNKSAQGVACLDLLAVSLPVLCQILFLCCCTLAYMSACRLHWGACHTT